MIALYIVLGILGLFLIFHFSMLYAVYKKLLCRVEPDKIKKRFDNNEKYDLYRNELHNDELEFVDNFIEVYITSYDGLKLVGSYYDYGYKNLVIFFHGAHSIALNNFASIAKDIKKHDYNILMIDERAHGRSEGKHLTYGAREYKDVLSWVDYVDKNYDFENIFLYGMSMGGTAVAISSDQISSKKVKGIIIDCAYFSMAELTKSVKTLQKIPTPLFIGWMYLITKIFFKVDLKNLESASHISNSDLPFFFIQGREDKVVLPEVLINNYNACSSYKEMMIIEGAEHTLAMVAGREETFNRLFKFMEGCSVNE